MPEPKKEDGSSAADPTESKEDIKLSDAEKVAAKAAKQNEEATPEKVKDEKDKVGDVKKTDEAADQQQQPPIGAIGSSGTASDKPATTVFVGGINERAPNSMMRELLSVCGFVNSWKRVTGADGKLQSFGFCEFADPVATMTCGRLLGQIDVAGKKLIVRVDAKSQGMLDDYKKRHELPDAPDVEKDEETKRRLAQIVQRFMPEIERVEDGELDIRAPKLVGPKESLDDMDIDVDKRNIINREIEFFRSRYRDDSPKLDERLERERERERERRRREKREKERERDRDKEREQRGSSSSKARSSTAVSTNATEKSTAEADEEAAERRRLEKKMLDKEESYQQELKHWTQREKKKARDAEKEREREEKRLAKEALEAREMRNFLAEYDDELDDSKFYRGDAFRRRLRERDRERELDERDRAKARDEVDEARRRLLAEGRDPADVEAICAELDEARDAHLRRYLTSPTPLPQQQQQQQKPTASPEQQQQNRRQVDEADASGPAARAAVNGNGDNEDFRTDQREALTQDHNDDDDEDNQPGMDYMTHQDDDSADEQPQQPTPQAPQPQPVSHAASSSQASSSQQPAAAAVPFANEEEKKALIKRLIDGIPTAKDELFAYNLDWNIVDAALMQNRVKPWINKKIIEYIGEEEAQLTEFVCAKVIDRTKPEDILQEMVLVLDDEAEVFVVKLWRLLIYETEAKKAGLVK